MGKEFLIAKSGGAKRVALLTFRSRRFAFFCGLVLVVLVGVVFFERRGRLFPKLVGFFLLAALPGCGGA